MAIKPMTYLVSFTLFVLLFMGLGGYVGYNKIAEHFLTQSFLNATPINVHALVDQQGNGLIWDDKVPLQNGEFTSIAASNQTALISIKFSNGPSPTDQPPPALNGIPLAANEHTEDIRIDQASHYLYARVFASSNIKSKETTWLYKYDLHKRKISRRASVNPILLPTPFAP
jgi:hypothetical protein